ncbi:MAG: hypothetical protein HY526_01820 [Betaproteobacteria bacterium]|nr:hypothetical protein [Betaproteobacteria bacterium]
MALPTIASRLRRRFIAITGDATLIGLLNDVLPAGWEMTATLDLASVGGFQDILQHRFILLDLDETALDAIGLVREVRSELMLNIPIFCFGGAAEVRDGARLARADRFFEREEIASQLSPLCEQFGWGAE